MDRGRSAIHPDKALIPTLYSFLIRVPLPMPVDGNDDGLAQITSGLNGQVDPFLGYAKRVGLKVHPYTLRPEENFLTVHVNGVPQSMTGEVLHLLALGVDGFFIDQPDLGVAGRDLFLTANGHDTSDFAGGADHGVNEGQVLAAFQAARCALDSNDCK